MDDFFRLTQSELINLKNRFLEIYNKEIMSKTSNFSKLELLNPFLDGIHRNLKPKIAVVGFSGVGKTTIKNLIKQNEIPLRHIPTISGEIASIKIANLEFKLFDFAGQEQFKYLWKGFIKGSNAVIIVTDSTPENVEKSRFFLKLVNEEAPYARVAVIGNKQDLKDTMRIEDIENIVGIKSYPMIANRSENRGKMINIISDLLELNLETSASFEKESILMDLKSKSLEQHIIKPQDMIKIKNQDLQKVTNLTPEQKFDEYIKVINELDLDFGKIYKKCVILALDLCSAVSNNVKGVKIDNILKNYFKSISTTLKKLNNNEDYDYEIFFQNYVDFEKTDLRVKNLALKQFLNSQFTLIKRAVEKEQLSGLELKEDTNIIINSLLCAYLTLSNPERFSSFKAISENLRFDHYSSEEIKEINAYYIRILNKIQI